MTSKDKEEYKKLIDSFVPFKHRNKDHAMQAYVVEREKDIYACVYLVLDLSKRDKSLREVLQNPSDPCIVDQGILLTLKEVEEMLDKHLTR